MTARVAILISGGGSNMKRLVESMSGDHPARAVLVLSNRPDAAGVSRARSLGVEADVIDHARHPGRLEFEAALTRRLEAADPDLICLAGFMRVLTQGFVARWRGRVLNIHPSLLPKYPGLDTHARAIAKGDSEAGCTVHEVTEDLDAGPVLGRGLVPVSPDDTPESLAVRVLEMEHRLYPAVLRRVAAGDRSLFTLRDGSESGGDGVSAALSRPRVTFEGRG